MVAFRVQPSATAQSAYRDSTANFVSKNAPWHARAHAQTHAVEPSQRHACTLVYICLSHVFALWCNQFLFGFCKGLLANLVALLPCQRIVVFRVQPSGARTTHATGAASVSTESIKVSFANAPCSTRESDVSEVRSNSALRSSCLHNATTLRSESQDFYDSRPGYAS